VIKKLLESRYSRSHRLLQHKELNK